MKDFLDKLREKYALEVGVSISIFDWLSFFIYLLSSHTLLVEDNNGGLWNNLLVKTADEIVLGSASDLVSARLLDYLNASVCMIITILIYKYLKKCFFLFFSSQLSSDYIDRIHSRFSLPENDEVQRIEAAKYARKRQSEVRKTLKTTAGVGFVFLSVSISATVGVITGFNLQDTILMFFGLIATSACQWSMYSHYTSKLVPLIILERKASVREFNFGEDY